MTTRHSGRHRAAVRPKTPLTAVTDAVTANANTVTRRSAVLAAASGLLVTGLPAADALTQDAVPQTASTQTASTQAASTQVLDVAPVESAPQVSAAADAPVAFAGSAVTDVTPPPAPKPTPAPERRAEPVSRSADRPAPAPVQAAPAAVKAEAAPAVELVQASRGGSVLSIAARYVGVPYRWGGTTPAGFDCSGFVQYVYKQVGVSLPRTAAQQQKAGRIVPRSQAQPGDIVSFVGAGGVFHNGLYAGGNEMYDAPRAGKTVTKRAIWSSNVTFTRVG